MVWLQYYFGDAMEMIEAIMRWIVAPVTAFVWLLHRTQQQHTTDIAVLRATMNEQKQAHDREIKEIRDSFARVMSKLDTIEQALRK